MPEIDYKRKPRKPISESAMISRQLLAGISEIGLTMAVIDSGYRKAKRTVGERYRRRARIRNLQRNAWRSASEYEKRAKLA